MKLLISAAVVALAAAALPAHADVLYSNAGPTGPVESPGSFSFNANSGGGAGALLFTIDGYNTLDGENCCTDIFTLTFNGTDVLRLTRNLGGGGNNVVYLNTVGAVLSDTYWRGTGYSFNVTIDPLNLIAGNNSFLLAYSGAPQGLGDEAWGLSNIRLSGPAGTGPVPEPASWALMIGGLGLVGGAMRRRKVAVRFA